MHSTTTTPGTDIASSFRGYKTSPPKPRQAYKSAHRDMKIGIFGGNGFVGSAIARKAVARGWNVVSFSRSGTPFATPAGHTPAWAEEVRRFLSTPLPSSRPLLTAAYYLVCQRWNGKELPSSTRGRTRQTWHPATRSSRLWGFSSKPTTRCRGRLGPFRFCER